MTDIDKLLEEREQTHGDAETTYSMAGELFATTIVGSSKMSKAGQAMLFLIMVKVARGIQNPKHPDHWNDIAGYAQLIKRVEGAGTQ